ncbi:hypothetical protein ACHQM5_026257 [Ranunculus cassubicifolius]
MLSLILLLLISTPFQFAHSHQENGEWNCESSNSLTSLKSNYRPGIITLDGHSDDWKEVDAVEFSLLPALDPHEDDAYKPGKMTVKTVHDGNNVFFLLEIDGDYVYTQGNSNMCPSVALMFQVGDNASYHNMGGCHAEPDACSNKTCQGHEVDIMHFSIGKAIPGRLYGGNQLDNRDGNGGDRFGHLVDLYAWNPHCRYLDGISPSGNDSSAQNDWKGAWWHDSLAVHTGFVEGDSPYASSGQSGKFYFEFSRPMRTMDRLQQDVQFAIGRSTKLAVAFWYPVDGKPWYGSGHYSINCDWIALDIAVGSSAPIKVASRSSWPAASAFSLLLSVVSICLSVFVGYTVSKNKSIPFTPMDHL